MTQRVFVGLLTIGIFLAGYFTRALTDRDHSVPPPPAALARELARGASAETNGKKTEVIEDGYNVRIESPENFPEQLALTWETGGRIPPDYHKLTNGALCLGSRVGLRLQMGGSPSLLRFVERCVIPYLYGYSYSVKHGAPPFGELAHGELGSLQDLAGLLGQQHKVQRCNTA